MWKAWGKTTLGGILIWGALYEISHFNYLLFHTFAELFSITVNFAVFMIIWNARTFLDDDFTLLICLSISFASSIDLLHTLAYKGMGVFLGSDANLPTQLWVAARYFQSLTLASATLSIGRKYFLASTQRSNLVMLLYALLIALLLSAIFVYKVFPPCYVEGKGLTTFKIGSEYLIVGILLATLGELLHRRQIFDRAALGWLICYFLATILSELAFTSYINVFGFANFMGHICKIAASYFLYHLIIETSIKKPYALLFRNFLQSEEKLRRSQAKLQAILNSTQQSFVLIDSKGLIQAFNQVAQRNAQTVFGFEMQEEDSIFLFVNDEDRPGLTAHLNQALSGQEIKVELPAPRQGADPWWFAYVYSPVSTRDGKIWGVCLNVVNITEQKQIEGVLRANEQKIRQLFEAQQLAYQEIKNLHERFQAELRLAHKIQESLLPPSQPGWPDVDVVCYSAPAREVGGDLYAYHALDKWVCAELLDGQIEPEQQRYALAVGDVTGKGMPAALLMAVSLALFRSVAAQGLAPGALLHHLDRELERYTKEWRMNCALCYIEITPPADKEEKGLIRIANSGLIPPFFKRLTGETEMTNVGGAPLGAGFGDLTGYPELELEVAPGDLLIITSDGAPEAKNLAGVMFGFERLEKVIAQGPTTNAQAMLDHLKVNLAAFVGAAEPHDDTTIVVIQMGCQASVEKQLQPLEIEAMA